MPILKIFMATGHRSRWKLWEINQFSLWNTEFNPSKHCLFFGFFTGGILIFYVFFQFFLRFVRFFFDFSVFFLSFRCFFRFNCVFFVFFCRFPPVFFVFFVIFPDFLLSIFLRIIYFLNFLWKKAREQFPCFFFLINFFKSISGGSERRCRCSLPAPELRTSTNRLEKVDQKKVTELFEETLILVWSKKKVYFYQILHPLF